MRVRLKGINWSIKKLADGTSKTYWYAWKGGPRLDAEPGTPAFMRLYNEAVASYKKKSTETFSSLIDYFKDCSEYKPPTCGRATSDQSKASVELQVPDAARSTRQSIDFSSLAGLNEPLKRQPV